MSVNFSFGGIDHKFNGFGITHAEPKGSGAGAHFIIWNRAFRRSDIL
jgi:hypothetical protein